jgi:hypothetical protein
MRETDKTGTRFRRRRATGLFDFFATASRHKNVAPCFGTRTLDGYSRKLSCQPEAQ